MSDYLYFPNKLKRHKTLHIGLYSKLKKFFTIKSNNFQRKHEIITTLSFYSSLLFVIEAVFISEQITECRIGATFWKVS